MRHLCYLYENVPEKGDALTMFYLLLAVICSASMAIALKYFQHQEGNRYSIIIGNYLTCIIIAFIMLPDKSSVFKGEAATVICGLAGGFFFVAALIAMQNSIRVNGAILTTAFSRLGLLVPLAVSFFLFGDRPGLRRIIGICLVLLSLWLLRDEERSDENPGSAGSGSLMLLLLTLLFFGAGDSISKVFENVGSRQQDSLLFFYLFVTAAVLTAILAFFEYRKTGRKILPKEMAAGIAVGIPNYFASSFLLQAVVRLPAFFVYPANSTGTILLVMAVSALIFGERPGKRQWAGIICILAALLCLS